MLQLLYTWKEQVQHSEGSSIRNGDAPASTFILLILHFLSFLVVPLRLREILAPATLSVFRTPDVVLASQWLYLCIYKGT